MTEKKNSKIEYKIQLLVHNLAKFMYKFTLGIYRNRVIQSIKAYSRHNLAKLNWKINNWSKPTIVYLPNWCKRKSYSLTFFINWYSQHVCEEKQNQTSSLGSWMLETDAQEASGFQVDLRPTHTWDHCNFARMWGLRSRIGHLRLTRYSLLICSFSFSWAGPWTPLLYSTQQQNKESGKKRKENQELYRK